MGNALGRWEIPLELTGRTGGALHRTDSAFQRSFSAMQRTGGAMQTTGGALDRTCGAIERHVRPLEPATIIFFSAPSARVV